MEERGGVEGGERVEVEGGMMEECVEGYWRMGGHKMEGMRFMVKVEE